MSTNVIEKLWSKAIYNVPCPCRTVHFGVVQIKMVYEHQRYRKAVVPTHSTVGKH